MMRCSLFYARWWVVVSGGFEAVIMALRREEKKV